MSHKRKILIVEDDYILYEELVEFFEEKGFLIARLSNDRAVDNYEDAVAILKQQEPDIAILDITIKGPKDGIDLGVYILQHYHIPVIYLSAYDNYENLERIRRTGNEKFVRKASKPLDKEQLWVTFELALPREGQRVKQKTLGNFFSVKEIAITKDTKGAGVHERHHDEVLEMETFLKWNDITFIESFNAARSAGNNNILIHTTASGKAYLMRNSLSSMEKLLPEFFVRFDQGTIVNLQKVEGRNKNKTRYLIGQYSFSISDSYKQAALEKINRWLSGHPGNIPES